MSNVFKDYRKESRTNWGTTIDESKQIDRDAIKLGAILRIADATEVMARQFNDLIAEKEKYERWYNEERAWRRNLENKIRGLKGTVTRLKRKANE